MDLSTIVSIAQIIVAIGVIVAITQVNITRKQLHFATLTHCMEAFREFENLKEENISDKEILNYVDLVNEELFYFQHEYLPKNIALEWIDGMVDYIPLTDQQNTILNGNNCIKRLLDKRDYFLKDYPRLKCAFVIKMDYDFDLAYNVESNKQELRSTVRKKIAEEIYANIIDFQF